MTAPTISWDIGTAYDFFASLVILHRPGDFSVRAAWAAGMRQRLPAPERELLERVSDAVLGAPPMQWIYHLPPPKDSMTVLEAFSELAPLDRVEALVHEDDPTLRERILSVAERRAYDDGEVQFIQNYLKEKWGKAIPTKYVRAHLDVWANAEEISEGLMSAFRAYYDVFFAEEERRIYPALEAALERAQARARKLSVPDLIVELSQGVHMDKNIGECSEVVFAPSFWSSPWIFYMPVEPGKLMILFGARPNDASLVPGEVVPDALVNALKALSDPTRLRILRLLNEESLTPTQLAHRLRLRTPTVVHHLKALRSAGLIEVMVGDQHGHKHESGYRTRREGVLATCSALHGFVLDAEGGAETDK